MGSGSWSTGYKMVITSTVIKILMVRKKPNVELLAIKHWGHSRSQDDKVYLSRNNIKPGPLASGKGSQGSHFGCRHTLAPIFSRV